MATYIPRARLFFLRNLILKKFNVKIKINCCTKMQPGLSFFYRIAKLVFPEFFTSKEQRKNENSFMT